MSTRKREELVVATGRRAQDGKVRVEVFTDDLLALSIDSGGERAATLLLTHEQAAALQRGLGELVKPVEHNNEVDDVADTAPPEPWTGAERRGIRSSGEARSN